METPTDDSVEIAVGFLKECGQKLTEVTPRGVNAIFERLRNVLHEGTIDTRVQYMVEVMFAVRKDGFKDHPSVLEDLDLVEEEDQFTHLLTLEDAGDPENMLSMCNVVSVNLVCWHKADIVIISLVSHHYTILLVVMCAYLCRHAYITQEFNILFQEIILVLVFVMHLLYITALRKCLLIHDVFTPKIKYEVLECFQTENILATSINGLLAVLVMGRAWQQRCEGRDGAGSLSFLLEGESKTVCCSSYYPCD